MLPIHFINYSLYFTLHSSNEWSVFTGHIKVNDKKTHWCNVVWFLRERISWFNIEQRLDDVVCQMDVLPCSQRMMPWVMGLQETHVFIRVGVSKYPLKAKVFTRLVLKKRPLTMKMDGNQVKRWWMGITASVLLCGLEEKTVDH